MLGLEDFMTIQALVKRGVYLCDIAEQLGVHPRTVSARLDSEASSVITRPDAHDAAPGAVNEVGVGLNAIAAIVRSTIIAGGSR